MTSRPLFTVAINRLVPIATVFLLAHERGHHQARLIWVACLTDQIWRVDTWRYNHLVSLGTCLELLDDSLLPQFHLIWDHGLVRHPRKLLHTL